jgi:multidrug efflux pump subunit AcrA (membrane-fusion protein)
VQVRPTDVDSVHVGLATEVHFTGLSQRKFPALHGRVAYISADSLQDPRSNATYFVAHVDVSRHEVSRLGAQSLQPGMPASVMIKTGERTALAYLTQPLTDSVNRAWRE